MTYRNINSTTRLCGHISITGSKSDASNSINYICNLYGLHKYELHLMSYSKIKCRVLDVVRANISEEDIMKGVMSQELMSMRDSNDTQLTSEEIQYFLNYVCTA